MNRLPSSCFSLLAVLALVALPAPAQPQERLPDSRFEYHPDQSVVLQEVSSSGTSYGWTCRGGAPALLLFLDRFNVREAPFAATFKFLYAGQELPGGRMLNEQPVTWHPWRGSPPVPGLRQETPNPSEAVRLRREGKPLVVEVDRWEGGAWYMNEGEEAVATLKALTPLRAEVVAVSLEHADGEVLILRHSFRRTDPALSVLPCVAGRS